MEGSSGIWDMSDPNLPPNLSRSNFLRNSLYGNGSIFPHTFPKASVPPPLPPRPNNANAFNSQGPYYNNMNYGGYPNCGASGYGYGYRPGFNTFGYGFGQNGYYNGNNPESRFIQLAEESSRPAFQAIQSVLQSFSSVAMMFDSAFNALHSSYISVINVADNFGKLRSSFGQVFSLLAVFRMLYWTYRRLLYILGISELNPEAERLWVNALKNPNESNSEKSQKPWPTMLLLSIIMAGPYLLFKLMSHLYPNSVKETWDPAQDPGTTAVGVYDFQSSNEQELSFSVNEKIMIAPEKFQPTNCSGWLLACNKNQKIGLIPKNYIGQMMRSEKTGKPYVQHNGRNFEVNNYMSPESRKYYDESCRILNELFKDDEKDIEENI